MKTMRSKMDQFFIKFILIAILVIGLVAFFPLFFLDIQKESSVVLILTIIFLVITGFILWTSLTIKYVFNQDNLFIKGGPFRTRIPYENITKVSSTTAVFTGFRVLSSKDAIEIFYKKAALGSVKISPKNKDEFISESKKRYPHLSLKS